MNARRILIPAVASILALSACGGEKKPDPAGPDVVGMTLPVAQKTLKAAGVQTSVHSKALFGILIPANYVVCQDVAINARMVRLEVSKYSCEDQ